MTVLHADWLTVFHKIIVIRTVIDTVNFTDCKRLTTNFPEVRRIILIAISMNWQTKTDWREQMRTIVWWRTQSHSNLSPTLEFLGKEQGISSNPRAWCDFES
jgi:hypothetical protein